MFNHNLCYTVMALLMDHMTILYNSLMDHMTILYNSLMDHMTILYNYLMDHMTNRFMSEVVPSYLVKVLA